VNKNKSVKSKTKKYIIEDFYKARPPRIYKEYAPCIRADRQGLKVVEIKVIAE
jgi:hypothetical protein